MPQRRVVLSGTVTIYSFTFGSLANYESYIRNVLTNNGFNVNEVRLSASASNVINNLVALTIDLSVDTQYTAQQARDTAAQLIATIPSDSYLFWGSPQFGNIDLGVVSDGQAAVTDTDMTRGGLFDGNTIQDEVKNLTGVSSTTLIWVLGAIFLAPYILDMFSSRSKR
jgi:hypothetical protein